MGFTFTYANPIYFCINWNETLYSGSVVWGLSGKVEVGPRSADLIHLPEPTDLNHFQNRPGRPDTYRQVGRGLSPTHIIDLSVEYIFPNNR